MTSTPLSNIRPVSARVEFDDVRLDTAFVIAGRPMTEFTKVTVHLDVERLDGISATGVGVSMLSVPWSWPLANPDIPAQDKVLRRLVYAFSDQIVGGGSGDPFDIFQRMYATFDQTLKDTVQHTEFSDIPRLAGLLALGAVDNAVHDAWSRAAGLPAYHMYTREYLDEDLGWAGLPGIYPGDYLESAKTVIPVQHVVGMGDPLTGEEAAPGVQSLAQWMTIDGVKDLKLKLGGETSKDAARIRDVYRVASAVCSDVTLSVDANEAYDNCSETMELLHVVEENAPDARSAITYLEQPFSRNSPPAAEDLKKLSSQVPVIMDEGYDRLSQLNELHSQGWSGVVIKASKGQSIAMITYAAAKFLGLKVVIQDLTTVDRALEHSVGLASALTTTWPHIEYNSRQYAAQANDELASRLPKLVAVEDGQVRFRPANSGLYGQ